MAARQLDILALEPFYGGVRKQTLDLLARNSRHRWSVYKLPARRMERRLNSAAQWFSQQINRAPSLKCDLLFTSDAMNLADFLRIKPDYGHKPSVTYFYGNQLASDAGSDQQARLAMLATATTSTELWFDSMYHMREFLGNAAAMYDAHKELGGKQPLKALVAKSQLIHPPVEIVPPAKDATVVDAERKGRTVCLDNREGADAKTFAAMLADISARREPIAVYILGKAFAGIPEGIPTVAVDIKSDSDVVRTLKRSEIYLLAHPCDQFDALPMRAMALGCIPVMPRKGFYKEFIPEALHSWCMYETPQELVGRIMDLWYLRRPTVSRKDLDRIFDRYTPIRATGEFDKRLTYLVEQHEQG